MNSLLIRSLTVLTAILATTPALAQSEAEAAVLPLEAQTCNLPNPPSRVPADADEPRLIKGKSDIAAFQAELGVYRNCLDAAKQAPDLTDGNVVALNRAYNYSVEMEERIAEQFNIAVRAFNARREQ